jgi:hypothetical protein
VEQGTLELVPDFSESRARREWLEARLAEVKLAEYQERLIDAATVKAETFTLARIARDKLLSIPDRIAAIMAAETDSEIIRVCLENELRIALEGLANE